jgi:cytochrome P450
VTLHETRDWTSDYDVYDAEYVEAPFAIWDELREHCPVARTERWGGSWLPTRYDDVVAIAHDVERFSSSEILVAPRVEDGPDDGIKAPPITSDPPEHHWARRLILPAFSPRSVARYESYSRELCGRLAGQIPDAGRGDAAEGYAQQIPVRVIARMLGVDEGRADEFTGWVRGVLEFGATDPERRKAARHSIISFFAEQVEDRRRSPKDDLLTELLAAEVDGRPVPDTHVIGTCNLILVAGIDTTWSAIGSALWHLATNAGDRARLVTEPDLMPTAVEELLRAYAPVTMARLVTEDVEVRGACIHAGDKVLMPFPAANRDPAVFPDADRVVLDRAENRHVAFGVGIHRCAGSNLARMELRVALEEWLARMPDFRLADGEEVTWAGGQVRGPRHLPVVVR